jgi:hypothetical protein
MLPTYTALFEGHRAVCLLRGIRYSKGDLELAQIGIARARLLAVRLAAGAQEDAPAALLLALLLERDALGEARDAFPVAAVRRFVQTSRGLDLVLDLAGRIELRAIRDRALLLRGDPEPLRSTLDEVRALLAACLRPLP